jgi:glucan phosphoethanolaminetransferase (alkaline phosphatase superfamily)
VAFWQLAFSWIGVRVPRHVVAPLSFFSFALMTAFGARRPAAHYPAGQSRQVKTFAIWNIVFLLAYAMLSLWFNFIIFTQYSGSIPEDPPLLIGAWMFTLLSLLLAPLILLLILFKGERLAALVFAATLTLFYSIIFLARVEEFFGFIAGAIIMSVYQMNPPKDFEKSPLVLTLMMISVVLLLFLVPILMLALSPLKTLARRCAFLAIGLVFLIGLNAVSKYAPEIRGLLKPPA